MAAAEAVMVAIRRQKPQQWLASRCGQLRWPVAAAVIMAVAIVMAAATMPAAEAMAVAGVIAVPRPGRRADDTLAGGDIGGDRLLSTPAALAAGDSARTASRG